MCIRDSSIFVPHTAAVNCVPCWKGEIDEKQKKNVSEILVSRAAPIYGLTTQDERGPYAPVYIDYTNICIFVCFRSYIFARAPFEQKLRVFAEEGRPDTLGEVWARSEQY